MAKILISNEILYDVKNAKLVLLSKNGSDIAYIKTQDL